MPQKEPASRRRMGWAPPRPKAESLRCSMAAMNQLTKKKTAKMSELAGDHVGEGHGLVRVGLGEEGLGGRRWFAGFGCCCGGGVLALLVDLVADQVEAAEDGAEDGEVDEEAPEGAETEGAEEVLRVRVLRGRRGVLRGRREWERRWVVGGELRGCGVHAMSLWRWALTWCGEGFDDDTRGRRRWFRQGVRYSVEDTRKARGRRA